MADIIQDRLNRISNLDDRKLLKSVLLDVFENVISYNMNMYRQLEERLYNEIDDPLGNFAICTGMDSIQNLDPISDFLHPMIPLDAEPDYDLKELSAKIREGGENVIASVFMKCDISTLARVLEKGKSYSGSIKTDKGAYEVRVNARRCEKYIKEIEKLYRAFQMNGVAWNTINCPYAYKFIDIVVSSAVPLASGEVITEIKVDLGEFEPYKELNVVPLWNIKRIEAEDKAFPMPAEDRINYDHRVEIDNYGLQNGYIVLADKADFQYSKRLEGELIIVSKNRQQQNWSLLQVEDTANVTRKPQVGFEILSNKRDLGFSGRYAALKSIVIRTMGEMERHLASYEQSKTMEFQGLSIMDKYERTIETIDYNAFIDDNIRIDKNKKAMLLQFRASGGEPYLAYDKISFLVSEVQVLFPEYKCVGELVQ